MSSKGSNDIVIKRRRCRTAVDPCLGYYGHDADRTDNPFSFQERGHPVKKDNEQKDTPREQKWQKDALSSDSVQTVTSPLSENTNIITVDDFLRQQVTTGTRTCRTTYSRKRQRRTLFSSDDDDDSNDDDGHQHVARNVPARSSSPVRPRPGPGSKRRAKISHTKGMSASQRNVSSPAETAFSKRIQRAAMLSYVDPDSVAVAFDALAPLNLVPREQLSPVTPTSDKRAKLIDPRIPRRLDTSFASKENNGTPARLKAKTCRPFLQWNCPIRKFKQPSPALHAPPSEIATRRPSGGQSHLMITPPLRLVSYEEHSEARAAKFDQKPIRRGRFVAMPPLVQQNVQESASTGSAISDELGPLMPLPLSNSPQPEVISQFNMHRDQQNKKIGNCQDIEPVFAPEPSRSPTSENPTHSTANGANVVDNNALESRLKASEELLVICAPNLTSPSHDLARSSPLVSHSQKPLRRLGTMLDGFRERARSILLTQTQSQALEHPAGISSDSPELRRARSRRRSSRRVVQSSPTPMSAPMSPSMARRTINSDEITFSIEPSENSRSKKNARRRKTITIPSVSAFLRRNTVIPKSESSLSGLRSPLHHTQRHSPPSNQTATRPAGFNLRASFALEEGYTEAISAISESNLFSNYNTGGMIPNLFDLIEASEPRDAGLGAQIVLSPSV